MTEFRKSPRIYVEVPAQLSAPTEGGVYAALFTHQLGEGGCMLKGMERVHPGRVVVVILDLDGFRISAISKILYESFEDGMSMTGVKFVYVSPEDARVLSDFVALRCGEASPEGPEAPRIFRPLA